MQPVPTVPVRKRLDVLLAGPQEIEEIQSFIFAGLRFWDALKAVEFEGFYLIAMELVTRRSLINFKPHDIVDN
jgi:hypothetical protein